MPSRRQSSAIDVSPRKAIEHNADLLFGRVVLPGCPPDVADKRLGRRRGGVGFLSHLRSLRATMSQKSSVPQAVSFVSQVLKRYSLSPIPRAVLFGGWPFTQKHCPTFVSCVKH